MTYEEIFKEGVNDKTVNRGGELARRRVQDAILDRIEFHNVISYYKMLGILVIDSQRSMGQYLEDNIDEIFPEPRKKNPEYTWPMFDSEWPDDAEIFINMEKGDDIDFEDGTE